MTTQPPTDEQHADTARCVSSHWSLPLTCALPRTHRDNWHSGWVVLDGERRYVRYRRTVGATERLETDGWKPLDIPGPRQEPSREQLLAEVARLCAELEQARADQAQHRDQVLTEAAQLIHDNRAISYRLEIEGWEGARDLLLAARTTPTT